MSDSLPAAPAESHHQPDAFSRFGAVLLFLGGMFMLRDFKWGILGSGLFDPDSYARMLRVERLLGGGGWYDNNVPWSNAPYGGPQLHWTRPLDALIAAGAIPLSHRMPLRLAVLWAGSALPVVLAVLLIVTLTWAARPYVERRWLPLVGLLAAAQPPLPQLFRWSYVDHHGLIALLLAIGWGSTARLLASDRQRYAITAGIAAGIGFWVSPEALGWIGAVGATLSLLWIAGEGRSMAAALAAFFRVTALTMLVALAIERRPSDWLSMEMDRISLPYVALMTALALSWSLVARRRDHAGEGWPPRFAQAAFAFLGAAAAAVLVFPKLLRGPLADYDPRAIPLLFKANAEFTPFSPGNKAYLALAAGGLVPPLIGALASLLALRSADRTRRRFAILTLIFFLIFFPLTLLQWRWVTYLNVTMAIPWTVAILSVGRWRRRDGGPQPFRLALAILLGVVHILIGLTLLVSDTKQKRAMRIAQAYAQAKTPAGSIDTHAALPGRPCSYQGLGPALAKLTGRRASDLIVMANLFDGPQIAWQAGLRVVGSPYRNSAGIIDTATVMSDSDEAAAWDVLHRRGVDFVVFCTNGITSGSAAGGSLKGLPARIVAGRTPAWLAPVALPDGAADPLLGVYAVSRNHAVPSTHRRTLTPP